MESGGRKNFGRRGGGASGGRSGGGYQGQGGGRGRGGAPRAQYQGPPGQQQGGNRPPVQAYHGGAGGSQRPWGYRPAQSDPGQGSGPGFQRPMQQPQQVGVGPTPPRGTWTGRPWGPPAPPQSQPQRAPQASTDVPDIQSLKISEKQPVSPPSGSTENRIMPVKRPDRGGTLAVRTVPLLVNHFPVSFNPNSTIIHYDVDVKVVASPGDRSVKKSVSKSDLRAIRDKISSEFPEFPMFMTAYDGEKNIFSAVPLPTEPIQVMLTSGEEGARSRSFIFTIKAVNELKLSKLKDYLKGNLSYIPRDILQGMDLVVKDNPSKQRISAGRSFYSPNYRADDDLDYGLAAYRGFQQSLRPTSQGLALCLDYSVIAFRKPLPVLEFLRQHIGYRGVNDINRMRQEVTNVLRGLKVRVTHRIASQKFSVAGLSRLNTRDITFTYVDPDGANPPREVSLVDYFREKWNTNIEYQNIPCLDLSKNNRPNYVPMEFCVLVEGQRYPKELLEKLDKNAAVFLKKLSLAAPNARKDTINEMVRATDGPCGEVMQNFDIGVDKNMTKVVGRVIGAPDLKLGSPNLVQVDRDKCQWNLVGKSFVEGKQLHSWALIDFTKGDRYNVLNVGPFVNKLMDRAHKLGMSMDEPLVLLTAGMRDFSSIDRIEQLLQSSVDEAARKRSGSKLQLIVCAMTRKDPGYKYLKWVSETKIGVITQCFLSSSANKLQDQYYANLCMKMNAKLGGSNVELRGKFPHFDGKEHVMFIGADVNHPTGQQRDSCCPSIAAVVGTVNWPAANRYAARVCPQERRKEKIVNFGTMCLDLVNTYTQMNRVRPSRIVVFRDGVSEGQFDMVLNEELFDLINAIHSDDYKPKITVVVAQKRHQTRLFLQNGRDGGVSGNVPPGTVVDTTVVHPFEFDFYLCSHYGGIGTSKPTHYYVLWDENNFTSDSLQQLIHHMCFTFARCTKPVSLVPPVFYADLVAYRGRMFQEVAMELQQPGTSSSSFGASFEEYVYTMCPELKNAMFFV